MSTKILLVEDRDSDAELIERALRQAKLAFSLHRAATGEGVERSLLELRPDIVITDHSLPHFTGMDALKIVLRLAPDVPVIVMTGSVDEETAVEYIKSGAADYVLKDRPARLPAAVAGALERRRMRQEARLADDALRHSEARYRRIIETALDAVVSMDADGLILQWNPQAESIFGWLASEAIGRSLAETIIPPAQRESHRSGLRHFMATGEGPVLRQRLELSAMHRSGSEFPVELTITPERSGDTWTFSAFVRDITERKRAEDELRKREEHLSSIYNTVADVVFELTVEGEDKYRFASVNPAFLSTTGLRPEQVIGKRVDEIVPEPSLTMVLGRYREAIREKRIVRWEETSLYPSGVRTGGVGVAPVFDNTGKCSHLVGSVHDLTERKQAADALRDSEERFRQMAEHIKEAFFVVDLATGTPLYVSPTWSEIWGRPLEDGRDPKIWFESVHLDDQAKLQADQRAVARGEPSTTTFRVLRPDGRTRWVRGRAFPVRDESGRVYRMAGVAEDITDVKKVEEQMTQAQKMEAVGRLAGGVAHDFNNLLTVIIGEADLARQEPLTGRLDESLGEIRKAGERAAVLTRQLLAFSRHQIVETTVFDLNDVVLEMDKMLRRLIGEDITIETRLAPDTGRIRADRGQAEQVLTNLVVNARDAMPDGGRLIIETVRLKSADAREEATGTLPPGAYAVLSLTDTGIGMDLETRSHIFEPFFTTKESGKGTGLGLSTVYGIVQQSAGQIGVYSEPGLGTTFRVYFPIVEGEPDRVRQARPSTGVRRGSETILLVEDEAAVRRLARVSLERQGYRVLEAGDPAEALGVAVAFSDEIHLLLTDVVMPGMGGQDLVARISPLRPQMKILFTSGYTERSVGLPGSGGKPPSFIQKPFTPEELVRKVRRVLDE